ncbi:NAD-dependent epimerase/dehydratase family protein [Luteimonas sp. MC1828]|nr:NAD-dependent epimerase/dehydratase family protein [Luteimonas sp. MC1828]
MKTLVTGTAGSIGSHAAKRLPGCGEDVIGVDNMSDYYDVTLKEARLAPFAASHGYVHVHAELADPNAVEEVSATRKPQRVVKLTAHAGVRYANTNRHLYVSKNVTKFLHVLKLCRHHDVKHLVFASTSSADERETLHAK